MPDSLTADYTAQEDILAGYGQARFDIGATNVIVGLRVENTRFDGEAAALIYNDGSAPFQMAKVSRDDTEFFPNLTVRENLVAASGNRLGASDPWTIDKIHALFPRLAERTSNMGVTLSGGEQQMLAVARALMLRPRLMLLDEPSFGLAPLIVRDLFRILGKINREEKVTILVVEQNAQLALELADQAYVIETGRIVMSGNAKDIANNEDVRKSYLGY